MKFISVLFFLIFNTILWSLINSVKNNKTQNELVRVEEPSKDLTEILNDGAESSVAPQIQKYKEKINPKPKIVKQDKSKYTDEDKKLKKKGYTKDYYQKHKEKIIETSRNWNKINKEKRQVYRNNNKERTREYDRKYRQNNKEKRTEYQRRYRQEKRNKKKILQNDGSKLKNIKSGNEGCSFDNSVAIDCSNKGKLPVICEEDFQTEGGTLLPRGEEEEGEEEFIPLPQGEEENNTDKVDTFVDEQNETAVEEPNKLVENDIYQINLNEFPFDLNEKPEEEANDI